MSQPAPLTPEDNFNTSTKLPKEHLMNDYLMENSEEAYRLDIKTDPESVRLQAEWAGIKPGMRVADIGCGAGKTSSVLHEMIGAKGSVVGIDASEQRLAHARKHYAIGGLTFEKADIRSDLSDLGTFDFIWMRFVLEYFRAEATAIVANVTKLLKPGGILCLIDLDHNCLNHHGHPDRLERTISDIMAHLEQSHNFDPHIGRKLYSYMFDLGLEEIAAKVDAHHLFYGEINGVDEYNWIKKMEVAAKSSGCQFEEYAGDHAAFFVEFEAFFRSPRRFSYTPLILCRGQRPE